VGNVAGRHAVAPSKGCLPAWMRWGVDGRMVVVVFSVPGAGALEEEGEFLASRWWKWSGM